MGNNFSVACFGKREMQLLGLRMIVFLSLLISLYLCQHLSFEWEYLIFAHVVCTILANIICIFV